MAEKKKTEELKSVKITWKEEEKWLCEYVWGHSSPSAWFKDLAIADYKRTYAEEVKREKPQAENQNFVDFLD